MKQNNTFNRSSKNKINKVEEKPNQQLEARLRSRQEQRTRLGLVCRCQSETTRDRKMYFLLIYYIPIKLLHNY